MGAVVIDASVLIGVLDAADPHHSAARAALDEEAGSDLRVPASAYAEVLVRPSREGRLDEVRADLRALGLLVDPLDEASAVAAAVLRGRHPSLRLPDALVLGHAEAVGADAVLTTDGRWGRVSPQVRIVL